MPHVNIYVSKVAKAAMDAVKPRPNWSAIARRAFLLHAQRNDDRLAKMKRPRK